MAPSSYSLGFRIWTLALGVALAALCAGCDGSGAPSSPAPSTDTSVGTKLPALAPVIDSVSPTLVPEGGGTLIVVTGRNLRGATVEVDGAEVASVDTLASLSTDDLTEKVRFEAPSHPAGSVSLTVRNANGTTDSLTPLDYRNVDPCADSDLTTPQLFPSELIEDGEGPLLYDSESDRLLLGLGTKIFFREGEGAWKLLKETYNPIKDMALDAGRGLLFVRSSGETSGGTKFLVLMQLDLETAALSYITPSGLNSSKCIYPALTVDPVSQRLFLACADRVMKLSSSGEWSQAAASANVNGNEFASLVAGTRKDGTAFVCAGVKTPGFGQPVTDGVYCQEGTGAWTAVPNTEWHQNFPYFPRQSLLFDPATSRIFSVVRDQDAAVLTHAPGQGWKELFSLPPPDLPSQAVFDPTSGRLYVTDASCDLSYFDGDLTEVGSLGGALTTFGYSSCAGQLALDAARGVLYLPFYKNTCEANDGLCPRLTDVEAVCLPK